MVYDITRANTYESIDRWLSEVKENADKDIVIMIVGNKSDLKHLRAVRNETGQEYAKSKNLAFLEASALDGNNVEAAFT